jgi:hypothetical protein
MIKSLYILTPLLAVLTLSALALAQGAPPGTNATPTPPASSETVTFKYLLEQQERQNAQQLLLQKEVADRAITAASQQTQAVLAIAETGAVLITFASLMVGWWVKRQFDRVQKLSRQAEKELAAIRTMSKEIEADLESFRSRIDDTTTQIGGEVDKLQESFKVVYLKARLAEVRTRLRSELVEDQRRAAEMASEIARGDGGAHAIPILLECLRMQGMDPSVVEEALYGLAARAKDLSDDEEALTLILLVSESPEKVVRKQALETIEQIGLEGHDGLKQRVQSCYEGDDEDEIKELAGRILNELVVT